MAEGDFGEGNTGQMACVSESFLFLFGVWQWRRSICGGGGGSSSPNTAAFSVHLHDLHGAAQPVLWFVRRSIDRLSYSLFLIGRLTGVFLFGLMILDRIESPTTAVILRLYSDTSIDSTPVASSTPTIVVDSLAPRYLAYL
jgi:hypothetical protein